MKNKQTIFILLFIIFQFSNLYADNDSLLNTYLYSNDVNARIRAYCKLTNNMMWRNKDSGRKMLDSVQGWVARKGNVENKGRMINLTGNYHWMKGNLDSAMYYYRLSLDFSIKNDLPYQYSMTVSNMGALFNSTGQLDSARVYLHKSLVLNQKKMTAQPLQKIITTLEVCIIS